MEARYGRTRGDRDDLIARVLLSFDVVEAAVRAVVRADQEADGRPSDPGHSEPLPLIRSKVLAEASLLLRGAARIVSIDDRIEARIDALACLLVQHGRGPELLSALCLEPSMALDHAFVHIHLRDVGYPHSEVDQLLAEARRVEPGPERLPHRELEQLWLAGIWSGSGSESAVDASLLRGSSLGRPFDVLGGSEMDAYSLTHCVLYASDMGRRTVTLPRPLDHITADAEGALAIAVDSGNFDLAAELLWTWPMLGAPWSAAGRFVFDLLTDSEDRHGFLPGPGFSRTDYGRLVGKHLQDSYRLKTSYHTTLVMGLLCSAMLASGATPAAAAGGSVAPIDALLHERSAGKAWHDRFHGSDSRTQNSLAPFLLSMALRRARDSHDFDLLRRGIDLGLRHNLLESPAMRQGVALLRRGTLLAKLAGPADTSALRTG